PQDRPLHVGRRQGARGRQCALSGSEGRIGGHHPSSFVIPSSFELRSSSFPPMGRIISLHSFRGGTGKSNITANLSYLLAKRGRSVAVLDTDIQSPGVHLIFGLESERITYTLSDAVLGKCDLEEAVYDLAAELDLAPDEGRLCLLPSSMAIDDLSRL